MYMCQVSDIEHETHTFSSFLTQKKHDKEHFMREKNEKNERNWDIFHFIDAY